MATRRANPASVWWNLAKTLAATIMVWAIMMVGIPSLLMRWHWSLDDNSLLRFSPNPSFAVALFIAASGLGVMAAIQLAVAGRGTPLFFDAPRRLVTTGVYGHFRHPIMVSGVLQGIAVAIFGGSFILVGYLLLGIILWFLIARPTEELELARYFGRPYEIYRRGVPGYFPAFRAWFPADDSAARSIVVTGEYRAGRGGKREPK